ncbi:hypothetical protein HanRHA438_Chr08g0337571 [Helianthus annuus]|uniref:Uncharacterized protein n=1 Tax=Helianthus annuus TaxID=4232 RepID=A0A9K3ICC2_HELAN|nr:hypothetical protein HanXRQr2_Chr08g0326421 [Helianthus annuus]KAJ0545701.1 hypothetical protein HanIR_Chr08g0352701 [Helianthus annuus]KAJ0552569.1 hypothetical protein HanHA89_Chr08g0286681 [Helianthus annuus]KAJ0721502.1 hypothetical protein HanOQP8_Chr08g0276251 [Helianthus annuus]KAJ0896703.1 hypothetical protein HanRHA438_Chr08g0337571 [Helianthus annuus]
MQTSKISYWWCTDGGGRGWGEVVLFNPLQYLEDLRYGWIKFATRRTRADGFF